MVEISEKVSRSLREYLILTGWVNSKPEEVSLETKLGNSIVLQYPYMTARMQCVVGPRMAVAAGREGILTFIPRSLRDEDKQAIIDANKEARLKEGDIEYLTNPERVSPDDSLEETVALVNKTGHSVIPVMDQFSELFGFYVHNPDNPPAVSPSTPIREVMEHLRAGEGEEGILIARDMGEVEQMLSDNATRRFAPIVDERGILRKLAFLQTYDTNFIGIAISTRGDWEAELERWGPQADTMTTDSSNACFNDAITVLKRAKRLFPNKPFGIGNIIQGEHFNTFADEGMDYPIGGMGVGSICQTGSERGNGRGQFTVAQELAEARDKYAEEGRYIPIVIDGGIGNTKDMTVALAFGDFIMMGNYFNRFYEAAARKFDGNKEPTSEEAQYRHVETWGEGHPRARLVATFGMNFREALEQPDLEDASKPIERYGHTSVSAATVEGVVGTTPYRGRLKPCVENDARYLRTTISNTGASNLAEFREKVILERASAETIRDMHPHDIEVTER